jgi:hypothetical protein
VCKTLHFDVGILTPDWLKDAKYLGQTPADNFVTNVWTKVKFINYYAEKVRAQPLLLGNPCLAGLVEEGPHTPGAAAPQSGVTHVAGPHMRLPTTQT